MKNVETHAKCQLALNGNKNTSPLVRFYGFAKIRFGGDKGKHVLDGAREHRDWRAVYHNSVSGYN